MSCEAQNSVAQIVEKYRENLPAPGRFCQIAITLILGISVSVAQCGLLAFWGSWRAFIRPKRCRFFEPADEHNA